MLHKACGHLWIFHESKVVFEFVRGGEETKRAYITNLSNAGDMTEARTRGKQREKERERKRAEGKASNKVEKVDPPATRARVIACFEQITDPWLRYGWFIRRGMHRSTNYLRSRRAHGSWIEYVQKLPGTARKSFADRRGFNQFP